MMAPPSQVQGRLSSSMNKSLCAAGPSRCCSAAASHLSTRLLMAPRRWKTPRSRPRPSRKSTPPFSEDSLYSLLVAELAGQRNRFDIALSNYVVQAQKPATPGFPSAPSASPNTSAPTRKPLDTSLLWAHSAPDNLDAQRAAAIQLARAGRYEESMVYMEKVLNGQGDTHFDFSPCSPRRPTRIPAPACCRASTTC